MTSPPRARHRPAPVLPGSPRSSSPAVGTSTSQQRGSSAGIYHDTALDDLCRIETFQNAGFSTKDFLAGISEKLIARSKADPGRECGVCRLALL